MKKRIPGDVIYLVSFIVFVVFIGVHSVAGENRLIRLDPEGKTISVVVVAPADNETLYTGNRSGLFKSTDTDKI